jgi:AraC family ethanolamine operon transcriptional activator
MAFLEEHHHEPVRVRELCQVAGVSSRTLNYAFQERFGVTPKRWVDSFRLHGVRGDLRRAAAGSVVADIANHWGFWHLGKFAADYRRQFGELPSMTLRRAKSRSAAPVARAAAG